MYKTVMYVLVKIFILYEELPSPSTARSLSVGGSKSRRSLLSRGYFSIKL